MFDKIIALLLVFYAIAQTEERGLEAVKGLWAKITIPNFTMYISICIGIAIAFCSNLAVFSTLGIGTIINFSIPVWLDHIIAGALIGSGSGVLNSIIGFFRNLKGTPANQ